MSVFMKLNVFNFDSVNLHDVGVQIELSWS